MRLLVHSKQEAEKMERCCLALALYSVLDPDHGMVPPTFRVDLSS